MEIRVKLDEGAYAPERAHATDAGLDIKSPISIGVMPYGRTKIDTGVHVEIPEGYVGMLKSKSGLMAWNGITSEGTIDAGYTGSIQVVLFNNSRDVFIVEPGMKISQLVILPVVTPRIRVVSSIDGGERGDNGFGSTGR